MSSMSSSIQNCNNNTNPNVHKRIAGLKTQDDTVSSPPMVVMGSSSLRRKARNDSSYFSWFRSRSLFPSSSSVSLKRTSNSQSHSSSHKNLYEKTHPRTLFIRRRIVIISVGISIFSLCGIFLGITFLKNVDKKDDDNTWLHVPHPRNRSFLKENSKKKENRGDTNANANANALPLHPKQNGLEGDTSVEYALLRKEYDDLLPPQDLHRIQTFVSSLRKNTYQTIQPHDMSYDIYNCPEHPPEQYPHAWNVLDVLQNWSPEDLTPHKFIYQGLCVFDYQKDQIKAFHYRTAEVPFLIRNDPQVMRTVERWNQPNYLHRLLGPTKDYITEFSHNNHFMYWNQPRKVQIQKLDAKYQQELKSWSPPTQKIRMTFPEWLSHANQTSSSTTTSMKIEPNMDHWYFRLIGCGKGLGPNCEKNPSEYLFDELDFFRVDPMRRRKEKKKRRTGRGGGGKGQEDNSNDKDENNSSPSPSSSDLYIVEPKGQMGIHCRFGMNGVIAENHWDSSRNVIVVLSGERRYLLSHPNQCPYLELLPEGHPSARHSAVDWTDPDLNMYPNFKNARVNEVVLQAGDVLYLPTNWFHYIISLELNYQCNTRSGRSFEYDQEIHDCGFRVAGH